MLIGAGSILLVPLGLLPRPRLVVTVPDITPMQALAGDFSRVAGDLRKAMAKVDANNGRS